MEKLLLRPEEAAQLLGLGRATVYELIAAGSLPGVRIGRSIRLRREDVVAWVRKARPSADLSQESHDE